MIGTDIAIYLIFALLITVIIWLIYLQRRLNKFFAGQSSADLESLIVSLIEQAKQQKINNQETERVLINLDKRLRQNLKKPEILRFNPFKGSGSNQSFSAAFLNEEGDGVVVSSLYLREGTSVYAKPIKGGQSEYPLTEEEKQVLQSIKK